MTNFTRAALSDGAGIMHVSMADACAELRALVTAANPSDVDPMRVGHSAALCGITIWASAYLLRGQVVPMGRGYTMSRVDFDEAVAERKVLT